MARIMNQESGIKNPEVRIKVHCNLSREGDLIMFLGSSFYIPNSIFLILRNPGGIS